MRDAVIVGAVRSAVGRKGGKLSAVRPDDLAAHVLKELVARVKIDPTEVEDVILGCVDQLGEQGFNIARNAALIAGFPLDVCGTTLDRMCGSGQQAANFAAMGVMAGQYDCVVAGGVEHMTRVPMGSNAMGPGEGPLSPKLQEPPVGAEPPLKYHPCQPLVLTPIKSGDNAWLGVQGCRKVPQVNPRGRVSET
jgi:acetyl-CoA acetyltransferase